MVGGGAGRAAGPDPIDPPESARPARYRPRRPGSGTRTLRRPRRPRHGAPGRTRGRRRRAGRGARRPRAARRCATKTTAARYPSRVAATSSSRWRAPRAVGASGNSARPPWTSVTDFVSTRQGLPAAAVAGSNNRSNRPRPKRGSARATRYPANAGSVPAATASAKTGAGRRASAHAQPSPRFTQIRSNAVLRAAAEVETGRRRTRAPGRMSCSRRPLLATCARASRSPTATAATNRFRRATSRPRTGAGSQSNLGQSHLDAILAAR